VSDPARDRTRTLIAALTRPSAYDHPVAEVEVIETHISVVLLAGAWAYKIKKPVDLGFLDFRTLERRRYFCQQELRLNRRLAPTLYEDVVPIVEGPDGLRFGGEGPVAEYAVRMRRFDQAAQLDRQLEAGALTPADMDEVAAHIAGFHAAAAVAPADSDWGTPAAVRGPVEANFTTLRPALADTRLAATLERLEDWAEERAAALAPVFESRRDAGRVRECHGDLHLSNMARIGDHIVAFDGIEFAPALRWIDVVSDSAFLLMDLTSRDRPDLGWRFMNGWLSATGDYDGIDVLDWYLSYRHLVRAKVDAIRLDQPGVEEAERVRLRGRIERHLSQAEDVCAPRRGALLLTHGLSGSGKSRLARRLGAALPAVVLRSDVERKRLHGLAPLESGAPALGGGIYSAAATERTYGHLEALAGRLLACGRTVIVDAAFLERARRDRFRALALRHAVPSVVVATEAPRAILEQRVARRAAQGHDASDAGVAVLAAQFDQREALAADERSEAVIVDTSGTLDFERIDATIRARIGRYAGLT
jgi:hypothetical protein